MQKLATEFFLGLRASLSLQPWALPASDGLLNKSERLKETLLGSVDAQWV